MAGRGGAKSDVPKRESARLRITSIVLLLIPLALLTGFSWYWANGQLLEAPILPAQDEQNLSARSAQQSPFALRESAQRYHYQLYRLSDAERAYRQSLAASPDDPDAHLGLANLLATCARRHEAVPHYLQLISIGAVSDFLMLLAKEDGVIKDLELLEKSRQAAPQDPAPLLGLAWHSVESGQQQQAERLLTQAVRLDPNFIPAQIAKASVMVEAGRWEEFIRWNADVSEIAEAFPQTWILRAKTAEHLRDFRGAVRCYGEALRLTPEARSANAAVARLLSQMHQPELAARFSEYAVQLQQLGTLQDKLFFSKEPNSIESLLELIRRYVAVGRFWEAMAWTQVAYEIEPNHPEVREFGVQLRERLKNTSLQLTEIQATPTRFLDLSKYALPSFKLPDSGTDTIVDAQANGTLSTQSPAPYFREEQQGAGINFQYFNGTPGEPEHRMYEFSGGGVAVLDYDADSFPDVYFTNGCRWPVLPQQAEFHDALYRNHSGSKFVETSTAISETQDGFGQGATIGDYDSDGFADIYVANIGQNRLYRNNGDGTFSDVSEAAGISGKQWTTSCVMVDLNGDTHPDIYDVNYVQGDDVFERICVAEDDKPAICMPFDFEASPDQALLNSGWGAYFASPASAMKVSTPGKGLGIVAFREPDKGLRLLVANDTTPNFLLVPSTQSNQNQLDPVFTLTDEGILNGVAFNEAGKAEGSMGIAVGDLDSNGRSDFVMTNFLNEANALYLQQSSGGFVERSRTTGLAARSLDQLGFGTQLFDANLDGRLELFVANGHIDDLRRIGKEYQMRPQLLTFNADRFTEFPAEKLGNYFVQRWLGRAVAKIDWNVDGKQDLLVGHLRSPSRLLTNATETVGNFLSIQLVGTESSRDAIGTIVTLSSGKASEESSSLKSATHQLTAGDGYQASNERRLLIGLGNSVKAERVEVNWPSGLRQSFNDLPANQQILLIEDHKDFKVVR